MALGITFCCLIAVAVLGELRFRLILKQLRKLESDHQGLAPLFEIQTTINDALDERFDAHNHSIKVVAEAQKHTGTVVIDTEQRVSALEAKRWLDPDGNVRSAGQ